MKPRLQNFFDRFRIKNKIIVACLPFLILSYVILFLSITLIMYQQMRTMVYDQTRQNIIEKTNLLNTLLNNYDQITTNYLYYTKDIQDYLITDQEPLSQDAVEDLHQNLASHTALLLTDHNPEIAQVSLFNKTGDLYTNNAIYSNTLATTKAYADSIHSHARDYHGKLILEEIPSKPHVLTVARTVYIPTLEKSDEEIGFLLLDISRASLEKQLKMQQNSDAIFTLLTDSRGKILINTSPLDDEACEEILLAGNSGKNRHYTVDRRALSYGGCFVTSIIDESTLFVDTYKLFIIELLIILLSVFIILFAIIYSGNMISGQVARFIRKLNETRQIDENAYISVESRDEFQELGLVYNNMLSRIDRLIHTVYLKEILTRNAQLESLQAQINPHFLYNTLDCVNSLVDMGEKEHVKKVVTSLASIMRMSIKGETFVTVEEDLSYIRQYIFIQKMRFQDKILFLTEVPESLYRYYIPKLTLQPLVETAVIHGVSNLAETGMIGIFGSEDDQNLYIDIKDNGTGMPPEITENLKTLDDSTSISNKHIGILNIQRKLQILYGTDYGLTISPISPHGTSVTICIPKSTVPYRKDAAVHSGEAGLFL